MSEKNSFLSFFSKKTNKDKNKDNNQDNSQKKEEEPKKNENKITSFFNNLFPSKKETINLFEDFPDFPEVDEPVIPLSQKEADELLNDPKFAKVKELKEKTDKAFLRTVGNKTSAGYVKSLVSKDKTRFCYDGFDLDLTYITPRIIAMGYPSKNIEGIYRNKLEDVQNFLVARHSGHYKVYNLCEERKYKDYFYKEGYYPFKDHEAPPINLIRPFCEDAKKFLDEHESNVVAIHCLAGKGRTGTFICCLLLYLNYFETAEECLLYYGLLRVGAFKGVTVPSQQRYIHYFENILKNNIKHPIIFKKICLRKLKMFTMPMIGKKIQIDFIISNADKNYKYSEIHKRKESYSTDLEYLDFSLGAGGIVVAGDVRVQFFQLQFLNLKNDKLFKFWFDTNFLPENGIFELKKEEIDKACKDKNCKIYKKDFKINLEYFFY